MLTSHNEYSGIGPVLRGCLVRGITSSYMESGSSWVCPIKCDERTQFQWSAYEPWGGDWSTHSIPKPNNNIMSSVMDHSIHQTKHPISSLSYVHKYKILIKGVPSAESSRSVQGLGKGVSGKPYPRLCNARRPRLEPRTFRSQAVSEAWHRKV